MELVTGIVNLATALLKLIEALSERGTVSKTCGRHFAKRGR